MRKEGRRLPLLLSVLGVLTAAVSVQAAEWPAWTFNVPVELTNVPPAITKGCVTCYVCATAPDQYTACPPVSHVASKDFPIINRSFNGMVTVQLNTVDGIDPYTGKYWLCKVLLYVNNQVRYVSQAMTLDPSKPKQDIVSGVLQ